MPAAQPVQPQQPVQPVAPVPQAGTKKCPNCGAEVEIDGMFCGICGFDFNKIP